VELSALVFGLLPMTTVVTDEKREAAAKRDVAASRRWRAIWRTHFYAGILSMPFLSMMALTGLVILYTQPYRDWTEQNLRVVEASPKATAKPLEVQLAAVRTVMPDVKVTSVVVPRNATAATSFGLDDGRETFVDPYTATVLGSSDPKGGLIGVANRFHGYANNNQLKVSLPSVSGLLGDGSIMKRYVVGDLLLEVLGGWVLVLVASGVYLWWPRRNRQAKQTAMHSKRHRWRKLHSTPGLGLSLLLGFLIVSGMPWSEYWGNNFTSIANKISPNKWIDAPNSDVVTLGDLDRFGNRIEWNTGNAVVPNSQQTSGSFGPGTLSLDRIVKIAEAEKMKPGYIISFPVEAEDDSTGETGRGSYTLANSWPRKTGESHTVYLNRYSGKTISAMTADGAGSVSVAAATLVSIHMGTQFGLIDRIVMTLACVLTIWSILSATVMFLKRRRPGTVGLPRRPRELAMANRLIAMFVVVGIAYPLWGASALIVLGIDKFVIRKTRLRATFGQRTQ
jgi:uncharacterized iron-regulated membrane protein